MKQGSNNGRELMNNKKSAIQISNLVKNFNGFRALNEISFTIEKGDVVGYLGPNGAGKTTTIKILTNLLSPTKGHAYINGVDVNRYPKVALQKVGSLIEVPGIYDYLTPHELLSYFGKVYQMDSKIIDSQIEKVLEELKIGDWEHKRLGAFSTGMQRRFGIAKALLHNPELLILDEPVLGLDPKGIKDIRDLIRQFQKEGITIFLSSHLLSEVSETCDRVIFLDHGNVVEQDTIDNVLKKTESKEITVNFLQPLSKEKIKKIEEIPLIKSFKSTSKGIRLLYDGTLKASAKILKNMVSLGLNPTSYSPESVKLEDFYISTIDDPKEAN